MKNQEFIEYAHHFNIDELFIKNEDIETINVGGQIITVLADIK